MGDMNGCIATDVELWFEKPGFPSGPAARAPRKPVEETCPRWRLRSIRAAAAARAGGAVRRTPESLIRRSNADDAGAQAVGRSGIDDARRAGERRTGSGRARTALVLAARAAAVGHARHGEHCLVSRLSPLHHHRHHRFRAGVVGGGDCAVQCPRQSNSVAHHTQHPDRDRLDDHSDRDLDDHRGAVVQAAVLPAQCSRCRSHREGDGQAVVLELQLSGQRPDRVRTC